MSEQWSCPVYREKDTEIERLTAELATLRESLRWKPVTEPPTREGWHLVRQRVYGSPVFLWLYDGGPFHETVTAWREILDGKGGR